MLDRRDLIRLITRATGLNLLAGGFFPGWSVVGQREQRSTGRSAGEPPSTVVDIGPILDAYFPEAARERVRSIAPTCLQELGEDEATLRYRLSATLALYESSSSREATLGALEEAVRADFERLRIRSIGGWQLAETEVRLCALVSPSSDRRTGFQPFTRSEVAPIPPHCAPGRPR